MSLASGVLVACALLVIPGATIARTAQLTWPIAIAVGPALTYGAVALAILPLGAVGIPWNLLTAVLTLLVVVALVAVFQVAVRRRLDRAPDTPPRGAPITIGPALVVAVGTVLGAAFIMFAAIRGLPQWQSIPSTWDSVWHANAIKFIVETGQASPTHMGELRNVETHAALYYPSAFHALAAMQCELVGAPATIAYTLNSLAASVWLFPVSAAALTWHLLRSRNVGQWQTAGSAAAAAALSASFTSVPYVEFDTASMPNLAAYGLAVPTMVLIVSSLRHRERIPLAVLALLGVFSVHITGGVVTVLFVVMWWLFEGLWRPVRGRVADFVSLAAVAAPAVLLLLPQFVGVLQQAEIIAGHEFDTHEGKKKALFDAVAQHTRHLNDYPIQNALILLAAIGFVILLVRRIWWPAAIWLVLVYSIVHSSAPFGGVIGKVSALFTDLFYSDPRRLSGVVTLLLAPMAGIALFTLTTAALAGLSRLTPRSTPRVTAAATAVVMIAVSVGMTWHYFPRHRHLIGEKYDQVMIDDRDLQAFAHLATLPGARDTLIGNNNLDGTAWMYAVTGLHPLWTHYDFPQQQGPGYYRFIIWAYADDADHDPRVAEAVRALNIRYMITSSPVVRGFTMPEGLVSLGKSKSWREIYDNGEDHIYEWQGK